MAAEQQKYYVLFSSFLQTVSTLIAFLVTGFALVQNMMDSSQQRDETLIEIHHQLKRGYHQKISILFVAAGLAIFLSLWMIYINGSDWSLIPYLYIITIVVNIFAIGFAILFIITIINPNKYKLAAKEILKEDKIEFTGKGTEVDQTYFMNEFTELEKKLKKIVKNNLKNENYELNYSFRQLVSSLFENELISKAQLYELLHINKYRNLIFHGNLEKVDKAMVERIKNIRNSIDSENFQPLA